MNFARKEILKFGSRLTSLGGRLAYDGLPQNQYIDIEEFFLDSTRFVFADERLARCIENWIRVYGFLISPSKIKRLIEKEDYQFDPAVLGVFLLIIPRNEKQLNLVPLKKYCKKNNTLIFRNSSKVRVKEKNFDLDWLEFNIATNKFVDEAKKNLLSFEYTLRNCPELRNRIEADDILSSDYKAYIQREGLGESLSHISKRIHTYYSNLHKLYVRFEKFGIHKKLVELT